MCDENTILLEPTGLDWAAKLPEGMKVVNDIEPFTSPVEVTFRPVELGSHSAVATAEMFNQFVKVAEANPGLNGLTIQQGYELQAQLRKLDEENADLDWVRDMSYINFVTELVDGAGKRQVAYMDPSKYDFEISFCDFEETCCDEDDWMAFAELEAEPDDADKGEEMEVEEEESPGDNAEGEATS